jgi:hypothetical protein
MFFASSLEGAVDLVDACNIETGFHATTPEIAFLETYSRYREDPPRRHRVRPHRPQFFPRLQPTDGIRPRFVDKIC